MSVNSASDDLNESYTLGLGDSCTRIGKPVAACPVLDTSGVGMSNGNRSVTGFRDDWHILRYLVRSRVSPTRQAKHHLSFVVNRDNLDRSPPYYLLRRTATGSSSCFCSSNFWSTMTTFIGSPPLPRNEITGHRHQIVTVWEGGGGTNNTIQLPVYFYNIYCNNNLPSRWVWQAYPARGLFPAIHTQSPNYNTLYQY